MEKENSKIYDKKLVLTIVFGVSLMVITGGGGMWKIDVHEHVSLDAYNTVKLISVMNQNKISKMVLLDSSGITWGTSDKFDVYDETVEQQLRMKSLYPNRFLVLYTFPPWDKDGPNKMEKYAKQGIDGMKFYNGVIYDVLGPINSSEMYKAYQKARELNLSVLIHVEALDPVQYPQFEQVLYDFPDVKFNCPHFCGVETNLSVLDSMLARHKNLFTDAGPWHRVGYVAVLDPERFREFFIKHADRIMYATDMVRQRINKNGDSMWLRCEIDMLEKEHFYCYKEKTVLRGLHLPPDVLTKIYQTNPTFFYNRQNLN